MASAIEVMSDEGAARGRDGTQGAADDDLLELALERADTEAEGGVQDGEAGMAGGRTGVGDGPESAGDGELDISRRGLIPGEGQAGRRARIRTRAVSGWSKLMHNATSVRIRSFNARHRCSRLGVRCKVQTSTRQPPAARRFRRRSKVGGRRQLDLGRMGKTPRGGHSGQAGCPAVMRCGASSPAASHMSGVVGAAERAAVTLVRASDGGAPSQRKHGPGPPLPRSPLAASGSGGGWVGGRSCGRSGQA